MPKNSYYSFSSYLRKKFGTRVHRISLNAGFTCPNRDGSLSKDGCVFCNEDGFSNFSKTTLSLEDQIKSSMEFTRKRFKVEKFIAYFQNGTNTYGEVEKLKESYDTIKKFPDIISLFISTRPDCIDEEKLNLVESYKKDYEVWIEYGLQTMHDSTLKRINRAHDYAKTVKAIEDTAKKNINVAVHVILGLPEETEEDMMKTAEAIANLPILGVKLHVLHVLKGTKLENLYNSGKVKLLSLKEYTNIACNFLERLKPECVIFRLVSDAKKEVLIGPDWINNKQKAIESIEKEFKKRGTCQGSKYNVKKNMCIR